jgi:hypothetical protein
MSNTIRISAYQTMLRAGFTKYRRKRFIDQDHQFEDRPDGGPVVFLREFANANLMIPPIASTTQRERIIGLVPNSRRHMHFRSMQSSQALAQSVFGTIAVLDLLPLLASVVAEDNRSAFGPSPGTAGLHLEKDISTLGEPRSTSVDAWLDGPHRVAIECKLSEPDFGTCSRPRLRPKDPRFATQSCNGTYVHQRGRAARCALTEIGVRYWRYMPEVFGWTADADHNPCPLASTYQLGRNVLAVGVGTDGRFDAGRGHVLVLYDKRNPAMGNAGHGESQWRIANAALRIPGMLRRLSWQRFIAQWPRDAALDWLKSEMDAKFGIQPS